MKILSVFGTRPEAIKMAPLVKKLSGRWGENAKVCITSQHREMLNSVLQLFDITPDFDLSIMQKNQTLTHMTQIILERLTPILQDFQPNWVLVQGDTTTSFAAALAAFYHQISVAHVEAGLRSFNLAAPWPEEANRQLISRLAQLHFAPTALAATHLRAENISEEKIHIVGNTVIDALIDIAQRLEKKPELDQQFNFLDSEKPLILVTGHRRESFGEGFQRICNALLEIAQKASVDIIYPVHLNPQVRSIVHNKLANITNIHLIEPLDYLPFVYLMKRSYFILTDSGGIQEEAPALGKPVLVMRDNTERLEAIEAGTARLVGTQTERIVSEALRLIHDMQCYQQMSLAHNPYGDGSSSQQILDILETVDNSTILD